MSYCRFENTSKDLEDCVDNWELDEDATDYELIKIMDSMQPDVLIKSFNKKKLKVNDFFLKVFDKNSGNAVL